MKCLQARHCVPAGLLVVAAFLAAGALAADKIPVTTGSREALSQFLQGRVLFDNLRVTDAIPYFKGAAEKDPNFALAHLYVAQSAPTAKEFFEALNEADESAVHASKGEQLYIKAFKAASYGDPATALKLYRELVEAFPSDERAQTLLGTSYFAQQEYAQSAEHLKKATELAPEYGPAYNQLGYTYRAMQKYDDAEKVFKKYTELLPTDPNPFDSYGELLLKTGRFEESIAQYEKALSINPRFASSFVGIASCLMYQDKHDEALAELQKMYDGARNDGERRLALFARGVVYQDEGKSDLALGEIGKEYAIAEQTNDTGSMSADLNLMANILLNEGKTDLALEKFNTSIALIRKSSLAKGVKDFNERVHLYDLAKVYVAKGDVAAAKPNAEKYRKEAEALKNRNQVRFAHELAGRIALQEKDYPKAIEEFKLANQQDPEVLYNIALALQESGKGAEAREYAEKAARDNVLPFINYAFVRVKAEKMLGAL